MTIIVSNRGPFRFVTQDDGGLTARPSPGGLASSLRSLLSERSEHEVGWIAAAHDDSDRAAIVNGAPEAIGSSGGISVRLLAMDPELYRLANDVVANQTLWFLHHGLFDLVRAPSFDRGFDDAWDAFRSVNQQLADGTAEAAGDRDVVLVQDYQLALVPGMLRARRPDLRIAHFTHTPFCGPNSVRVLPGEIARELCASMATVPTGFHGARWARAYAASTREILGQDVVLSPSFVAPLGPDADALARVAESSAAQHAGRELDELVGDRKMILRVDRIDPSKNIARGFAAYDLLLSEHAEWREQVVFVAKLNASRETLPEYIAYRRELEVVAAQVNERWGTQQWQPIVLDTRDDYADAVGALARYDVLLVNPIKDGLNLVAKEGPLLNARDGVLCLSPDAGAWEELSDTALRVHPYDLEQTASALHAALSMPSDQRSAHATRLRALARARSPRDWLEDQLTAAR